MTGIAQADADSFQSHQGADAMLHARQRDSGDAVACRAASEHSRLLTTGVNVFENAEIWLVLQHGEVAAPVVPRKHTG